MPPSQAICCVLETFPQDMADCQGDVPRGAGLPDILDVGLEEGIPAFACLEDDNSS